MKAVASVQSSVYGFSNKELFDPIQNYQKEFQRAPTPEADIPGGFHKHPRGAELALQVRGYSCYLWTTGVV